jgi:hypothetical protein
VWGDHMLDAIAASRLLGHLLNPPHNKAGVDAAKSK